MASDHFVGAPPLVLLHPESIVKDDLAEWRMYVQIMRKHFKKHSVPPKQQVDIILRKLKMEEGSYLWRLCYSDKPQIESFDDFARIIESNMIAIIAQSENYKSHKSNMLEALKEAYERARNRAKSARSLFKRNCLCCVSPAEIKPQKKSLQIGPGLSVVKPDKFYFLNNVKSKEYHGNLFVSFKETGAELEFVVDPTSHKSFITKRCYQNYFAKVHRKISLDILTDEKQEYICVAIVWGRTSVPVEIFIVESTGHPAILGRDWLEGQVFREYPFVFIESSLTGDCSKKIKVDFKDKTPVYREAYALPPKLQDCVEKELNKLERDGTIYRIENPTYATPIIPFVKNNYEILICPEYNTTVNPLISEPQYRLPRVALVCAALHEGQHFTRLDLSDSYKNMLLENNSQLLTAINTHLGTFAYRRVPFGLKGTLPSIQTILGEVLKGLQFAMVLDDIWVTGKHWAEHLKNLRAVLDKLKEIGFHINWAKSDFFGETLRYAGYGMNKCGFYVDQKRMRAITDAPNPKSMSDLKSFLGLVNFYRKFCLDCHCILKPLYALLDGEGEWHWTTECETAYAKIKCVLTSFLVSAVFVDDMPLVLAVASGPRGVAAVLSHVRAGGDERPIACASRTLSDAEAKRSQLDKEMMAVAFGVEMHRQYLYGHKFVVRSDQRDLRRLFSEGVAARSAPGTAPGTPPGGLQWNLARVADFNFNVEYAPAGKNEGAVALSRLPLSPSFTHAPRPLAGHPDQVHISKGKLKKIPFVPCR